MKKKSFKPKTRNEVLKGGLNVTFAIKPKGKGFMVSGVWISEKLWNIVLKKYKGNSYFAWKTLSDWFKKRDHLLDKAVRAKKK